MSGSRSWSTSAGLGGKVQRTHCRKAGSGQSHGRGGLGMDGESPRRIYCRPLVGNCEDESMKS